MTGDQKAAIAVANVCREDFAAVGFISQVAGKAPGGSALTIKLLLVTDPTVGDEGYNLRVREDGKEIILAAKTASGLFWGSRTLLQLLWGGPGVEIPQVTIADKPAAGYRGLMIDNARNFHTLDFHMRMIKAMSLFKLNFYHIHFSDNQGYTLPTKGIAPAEGGGTVYSRADIKKLNEYAAQYQVTIVPEVDVPGHASVLLRLLPQLQCTAGGNGSDICLGAEASLKAVEEIIGDTIDLFPGPYYHLGADEVNFAHYAHCTACQKAIRDNNLKDIEALYRSFINRMHRFVKSKGKRMIVWEGFNVAHGDPVIDRDVIVMPFDSFPGRTAKEYLAAGHDVINCAWTPLYVVYTMSAPPELIAQWNVTLFGRYMCPEPIEKWYKVDPTPKLMGAQMCSWENAEGDQPGLLFGQGPKTARVNPAVRLPVFAERIWLDGTTDADNILKRVESLLRTPMLEVNAPAQR